MNTTPCPSRNRLMIRIPAPLVFFVLFFAPLVRAEEPAAERELVNLSPFVVNSQSEDGYAARQTLSATRTATIRRKPPSEPRPL